MSPSIHQRQWLAFAFRYFHISSWRSDTTVMRPISMSQTDHAVGSGSQFHGPAQSLCFPRGETSSSYCYPFLLSIFSLSLLMPNSFLSSNFCFLSHFLPQSYYLTFQPCFPFKDSQDGQVAGPASLHLTLFHPPTQVCRHQSVEPQPPGNA